jgi:ATP-dependent DNA ligase
LNFAFLIQRNLSQQWRTLIYVPRSRNNDHAPVEAGAVPAEELKAQFPVIDLPIQPPFPPMEARLVEMIPPEPPAESGHRSTKKKEAPQDWLYEPKWDGFRCLAFRKNDVVLLQSKAGQPLARYFPELVEMLRGLPAKQFVLDGEIVIAHGGVLSFDDLLLRIHPAESRIRKLARETPASLLVFDLLIDERGRVLLQQPLRERRAELEEFFAAIKKGPHANKETRHDPSLPEIRLSPASRERTEAERWMHEGTSSGLDGVIAKRLDAPYAAGERSAMRKIKSIRTADCVVGGFRYASKGGEIGSLLLGLYGDNCQLHHVGFTSSFNKDDRRKLKPVVEPLRGGSGFSGRAPGGPSRWATERTGEWEALDPKLVCEVRYDHFSGGRFRHGTKFLRWRPEKAPSQCRMDQVERKPRLDFLLKTA